MPYIISRKLELISYQRYRFHKEPGAWYDRLSNERNTELDMGWFQ